MASTVSHETAEGWETRVPSPSASIPYQDWSLMAFLNGSHLILKCQQSSCGVPRDAIMSNCAISLLAMIPH